MIDAYVGPSRVNGATPPTSPRPAPAGAFPSRTTPPAGGQPDTGLEQAIRRAARMRVVFYVVVLLVALTGQVTGAARRLDIPLLVAIPAVGALELGGVVVMANADVRRRLGERAITSRILSAAIAAGAVGFNWLAHDNHLLGGFFAGMSALGYLVWVMHAENVRRDRLRALGALAATTPSYEVIGHWLTHPLITRRARSMAKADPGLGLYGSLDAARAALRREGRDAAIVKILRRKINAAVDPATAAIAVHVYDLDEIAARLADTADYDGLASLIAADLTPARIATGAERRQRRRFGRWPVRARRPGSVTPLPPRDDPPATPVAPQRSRPADTPATRPHRDPHAYDDTPDLDQPESPVEPANEHTGNDSSPDQSPRSDKEPDASARTNPEPEVLRHDRTGEGGEESGARGVPGEAPGVPGETAAAVAYWLNVDPTMGYDEIAKRIGRTERTVRRNLPPGFRRRSVRGRP
ncbi:hypothetical protein [Micromonospora aurantiaca (nom. illeg.)]|uniref:hypothetical protein n=1 Tax=Micromonospora aurantiaca (nom. illeg.) TaxID=47850 RepID=UPI0037AF6371